MIFSENTIKHTYGDVVLTVLAYDFLSLNLAGKYTKKLWFLFGTSVRNYWSACESMTNPSMKLTMMMSIRRLKTIQEKMIALKLHLPSRWNNHPKKLYCSLQSKLQWRSVQCRPWIFLENTEWQNVSIDSSNWEGLSEFSGMDISSDGPDWELWSILL